MADDLDWWKQALQTAVVVIMSGIAAGLWWIVTKVYDLVRWKKSHQRKHRRLDPSAPDEDDE